MILTTISKSDQSFRKSTINSMNMIFRSSYLHFQDQDKLMMKWLKIMKSYTAFYRLFCNLLASVKCREATNLPGICQTTVMQCNLSIRLLKQRHQFQWREMRVYRKRSCFSRIRTKLKWKLIRKTWMRINSDKLITNSKSSWTYTKVKAYWSQRLWKRLIP